jgi:hypothetical protein
VSSYRRGYYIVAQHTTDHASAPDVDLHGFFVAIMATALVLVVVVLATDPSLSAGTGHAIRTAWSDIVQLIRR